MKRSSILELVKHLAEGARQRLLTQALGQITCSADPTAHDVANLPCRSCGAAL